MAEGYRVSCPGIVRERFLGSLKKKGLTPDENKRVQAALKRIEERLRLDPSQFGEPRYHLPTLNLEVRIGIEQNVSVSFGVNKSSNVVIINDLVYLG